MYNDVATGFTVYGEPFYVSIDDLERVSKYTWYLDGEHEYIATHINGKKVYLHRFIMCAVKGQLIDHIDRVRANNVRTNLRVATKDINSINSKVHSSNTSGVRGVTWSKNSKKWFSQIMVRGKTKSLGYYHNFDDAVAARRKGELKYFGENSPLEVINE
jgi:hypothetical protein